MVCRINADIQHGEEKQMSSHQELFQYKDVSGILMRVIRRTDNTAAKDIYLYDIYFYIGDRAYNCYIYALDYGEARDIFLSNHPSMSIDDIFNIRQLG